MSWLVDIDTALLRLLNLQWTSPFLDRVIPPFSHFDVWMVPFIVLMVFIVIIFIVLKERVKGFIIVAGLGLAILLSEAVSTMIVKELIDRVRPCHIHQWVRLIEGYCPKSPAFPSTHATNIMAGIMFLSLFFPRWLLWVMVPVMVPLALLVGYSRVYLGVHYPLDVIGGWILGACCGWVVFIVFTKFVFPRIGIKSQYVTVQSKKRSSAKRRRSA